MQGGEAQVWIKSFLGGDEIKRENAVEKEGEGKLEAVI